MIELIAIRLTNEAERSPIAEPFERLSSTIA